MAHSNSILKVVIVDDHFLFSVALDAIIRPYDSFKTIAMLSNGSELMEQIDKLRPDVVFMDVNMPVMDGLTFTRLITQNYPAVKVIGISALDHGDSVRKMMDAGAWGYITKDSSKKEYDELFNSILKGQKYISTKAAMNYTLSQAVENTHKNIGQSITKREIEIIKLAAQGYSDKEIAKALNVSHRTIDAHKQKMMHKLGTRKSTEIVAIAYRMKWI